MVIIKCRCVIQRFRLKKLESTSADMRDSQQYQHPARMICRQIVVKNNHTISFNFTVNGGWSPWKPFSACTATCGPAFHTSTRLCNNPSPLNGGKPCVGNDTDTQPCRELPLCASKQSVFRTCLLLRLGFQFTNNNVIDQGSCLLAKCVR